MENINNITAPNTSVQLVETRLSKSNIFKYLFIISIILLLAVVSFIFVLNKKNTDVISEATSTIIPKDRYVYTYIDGKVIHEWGTDYASEKADGSLLYTSVRLPQINSTAEVAKSINTKILDKYKYEIDIVKNSILERKYGNKGAFTQSIDYNYELKDDIAYILINDLASSFKASGGRTRENIFYDVKNDKQFTVVEMLTKLNITEDMIFNGVKSKYPNFGLVGESQVIDAIKNNKENSITIMPEISSGYTLYLGVGIEEYEIHIHP